MSTSPAQHAPVDCYAVLGNPIAHSKSPEIHALFAAQTRQHLRYEARLVALGEFERALDEFQQQGGRGVNVTVPFKQDAWAAADSRSARAQRAGAVNTLVFRADGSRYGDTTDGVGLVRDLSVNLGMQLIGKKLLLLGAGGAARGVLEPLLAERPREVVIANRTRANADRLVSGFAALGNVRACGLEALDGGSFDIVINATAAGLQGEVPSLPDDLFAPQACAYDLMYGDAPTAFMRWAQQQQVGQVFDGLGMLVEQAAESFYLWRDVRPDTAPVIARLRHKPPRQ